MRRSFTQTLSMLRLLLRLMKLAKQAKGFSHMLGEHFQVFKAAKWLPRFAHTPARRMGLIAETKARYRPNGQMKRITGRPTLCGRISEWPDHLPEFKNGARSSMRHEQRKSLGMRLAYVQEMHAETVDLSPATVPLVELGFNRAPVIVVLPITHQRA